MSLEICTREIDGYRYTYQPLGAKAGMRLFTQLVQRLGDSLGSALAGGAGADKAAAGANAIGALAQRLDPDFVASLVDTMAAQTRVELDADSGRKLVPLASVLDMHFACRTLAQFQWLEFCLESQYTDFLGWLRKAIGGASPQLPPKDG